MTAVKFFGCLDQITGILYTGSLISRMHCELRKSDIHGIHGYLRHCNISQCTSTCRIRTVGKKLHRYTCLFTDCLENRNTYCITGIFLTGMRFDHDSFVHIVTVIYIRLLLIIRVYCMCIITAQHKTSGNCTIEIFLILSQCLVDPPKHIRQQCRCCSLLGS